MQGRALTPDVILSGNLSVSKTVNLQNKVIYNNGQYEADEGYDGLGKVTVDVHNEMTDLKVAENGVYLPPEGYDGFDRVDVDVPDPELDTIHITQNGRYTPPAGVVGYDDIHVNVNPNLESKTITANGYYEPSQGKNGFSEVTVNVPERVPVIESKSITENGTYTAPTGVDGYSPITVNVPERVPVIESKSITENGTYTAPTGVDGYSPITVNVPLPANAYLLKELSNLPQPIASFSDGSDAVMQSLKVSIEPVQSGSGDPSPTNVRPISGWSGANISVSTINIFDKIKLVADKWLNISNGELQDTTGRYATVDYLPCKPNVRYYFASYNGDTPQTATYELLICWYDKNKNFVSGQNANIANSSLIFPSNAYYYRLASLHNYDITINYPNTEHAYIPYNGHNYAIPFTDSQGNPVEVYGGSVDVVNGGEQPRTLGSVDLGTITWSFVNQRFFAKFNDIKVYSNADTANLLCDRYKPSKYTSQTDSTISSWNGYVYIRDDSFNGDTTAFKTAMNGAQLVYELATPTTFYTQPTSIKSLDGENNVFASTGDVTECEYFTPGQ